MHVYTEQFYDDQSSGSLRSAKIIVPGLIKRFDPKSVLDVGCGVGTWLSVFIDQGVSDIQGIDGPYVEASKLQIPADRFMTADLNDLPQMGRGFDLAMTLEVAEHLPDASSDAFVGFLTSMSKMVLFSAAIPFQGGEHHINEQWPSYWADKFRKVGYFPVDFLRKEIWVVDDIEFWYRQNMMLFINSDVLDLYGFSIKEVEKTPLPLVHPEQYLQKISEITSMNAKILNQESAIKQLQDRIEEIKNPSKSTSWDAFVFFLNTLMK